MKHGLREVISFESCGLKICFFSMLDIDIVPKGRSVMAKGLRSVQQVSSSSQGVHLL
jgi:hypothetical protein